MGKSYLTLLRRKKRLALRETYVPSIYWETHGKCYSREDVEWELDNLSRWIEQLKPTSILDVGPGWGHVYLHLSNTGYAGDFAMCDFVESMRQGCKEATGILPDKWDGKTLPYDDDAFDLVLSFWVLLHVQPIYLDQVFREHIRVTRHWLSIVTLFECNGDLAPHCFIHDYAPYIQRMNIVHEERSGGAVHWLLEKNGQG